MVPKFNYNFAQCGLTKPVPSVVTSDQFNKAGYGSWSLQ